MSNATAVHPASNPGNGAEWQYCLVEANITARFRVISSFIIAIIQWKETPLGDFCQFLVTCL